MIQDNEQIGNDFLRTMGITLEELTEKVFDKIAELEKAVDKQGRMTGEVATMLQAHQTANKIDSEYCVKKAKENQEYLQKLKYMTNDTNKVQAELRQENKDIVAKIMKLETLCVDTRQLILQCRQPINFQMDSGPNGRYPPSPLLQQDRQSRTPVPHQGHRSRTPTPQQDRHSDRHSGSSSNRTPHLPNNERHNDDRHTDRGNENHAPCAFCAIPGHLPEDCENVATCDERRKMVTEKDRCYQCLEPRHRDKKDCHKANTKCGKCAHRYFKDPQSTECQHHIALCDLEDADGSHNNRRPFKRGAPPAPQPRASKMPRNNLPHRRGGGYRGHR